MLDRRNLFFVDALGPPPGTDCWHEGPSLIEAVRGVTAAEAIWKPVTKSHGIWELVLHCAYWKFVVRRFFEQEEAGAFPRSPQDWPKAPKDSDEQAWSNDRALWRDEHRRLREAIAKLPPKRWDLIPPGGKQSTYAQLVVGIACHDAHHTGQIQLLKRLARTKKIKSRSSA